MANKQKLELTWLGKENRPKLEPRILLEDASKSYHAQQRVTDKDLFDNRLIFGDSLRQSDQAVADCALTYRKAVRTVVEWPHGCVESSE